MLSPVRFNAKAAEPTEEYVAVEKETCVVNADEIGTTNERLRLLLGADTKSGRSAPQGSQTITPAQRRFLEADSGRKKMVFLFFNDYYKNIDKSSLKKILFRFQTAGYLIYHYIITNYIFIHK